jgi:hypothetical protein
VRWGKRAGRIVLFLLLAELVFFFVLGLRIRKRFERPREILGSAPEYTRESGRQA